MSKYPKIDRELLDRLTAAIESCWNAGSPVVGDTSDIWREFAHVAIRRIRSFERRRVSIIDYDAQIRDIAQGFVDRFERDPKLVGPLFADYDYVAQQSLDAFRLHESKWA